MTTISTEAAAELLRACQLLEAAEDFNANDCGECEGEGVPELCPVCFPKFDDARIARRNALAKALSAAPARPTERPPEPREAHEKLGEDE